MSLLITFFSAISFLYFGIKCLTSDHMVAEFERYRLDKYRKLVGCLQLMGAFGLVLGYIFSPELQCLAAIGISILMVLGFIVRVKIRDSITQILPSLSYALLNAYLVYLLF